ncbi:MAG: hypothetical protein LBJ13_03505 [Puniceicoccales bacterium]|jgi:hypothetical protein|nr:hypothetical protein [Puniceicoccales bacterium]
MSRSFTVLSAFFLASFLCPTRAALGSAPDRHTPSTSTAQSNSKNSSRSSGNPLDVQEWGEMMTQGIQRHCPTLPLWEWIPVMPQDSKKAVTDALHLKDLNGNPMIFSAIQRKDKYAIALFLVLAYRMGVNVLEIRNQNGFNIIQYACALEDPYMLYYIRGVLDYLNELGNSR